VIAAPRTLTVVRSHGLKLSVAAAAAVVALMAFVAAPAIAAGAPPAYSNIPAALPGNVPSVGFEATSTSEFGDFVQLEAATTRSRAALPVTVVMSIWACESGGNATCQTTPGAGWSQAITLKMYAVDESGAVPAVGAQLLSTTRTFVLPYRPSYDPAGPCAARSSTGWYFAASDACYNGLAHPITFGLPAGADLPDRIIWTISYNTSHHGYSPTGVSGPWDSLNVGARTFSGEPSRGTDVEPAAAFMNSTWSGAYSDGGATGSLRDDTTGWDTNAPLACIGVSCAIADPLATAVPTTAPTEIVGGATGTPGGATPPPTSTNGPSDGGSSTLLALSVCAAFAVLGLLAVNSQRRVVRR
jgi:hypothetical protein